MLPEQDEWRGQLASPSRIDRTNCEFSYIVEGVATKPWKTPLASE